MIRKFFRIFLLIIALSYHSFCLKAQEVYDMGMAKEICDTKALDNVEGIWVYPEDKVTVLITKKPNHEKISSLNQYSIRVIEGEDCRLEPGVELGLIEETAASNTYKIELYTEEKNMILLKPVSCLASLSKDNNSLIIKKSKNPFRFRLNFNFNRLLTGFWKIVSIGISKNNNSSIDPPVGMVKIYPSFDGNGSLKGQPRYL